MPISEPTATYYYPTAATRRVGWIMYGVIIVWPFLIFLFPRGMRHVGFEAFMALLLLCSIALALGLPRWWRTARVEELPLRPYSKVPGLVFGGMVALLALWSLTTHSREAWHDLLLVAGCLSLVLGTRLAEFGLRRAGRLSLRAMAWTYVATGVLVLVVLAPFLARELLNVLVILTVVPVSSLYVARTKWPAPDAARVTQPASG